MKQVFFTTVHFFESLVFARGTKFTYAIMLIFVVQTLNFVSRCLETRPDSADQLWPWTSSLASLGLSLLINKRGLGETDDSWGTSLVNLWLWLPQVSYGHYKGLVHWSQGIHLWNTKMTNILVTQMEVLYKSICEFAGFSRPILTTLGKWLSNLSLRQNCLEIC